jgi:cyclohexadienyl dehydratase
VQQRLHDRWRAVGPDADAPQRDLTHDLRPRIDALTADLLRAAYLALPALAAGADTGGRRSAAAGARLQGLLTAAERAELQQTLAGLRRERAPALKRSRTSGVLRIGTTGDYAPFSIEHDGRLGGADIALARQLALHLGVAPVFVRTSWPTLLADLAADRYDVALAGISVTPERRRMALFSRAYHRGGKTPIARCAERERFDTLAEIDAPGVRVIVNPGGTNERYARQHLRLATIRVHPDNRGVFDEIVAGRADVMITDDVEVELQVRRHPALCRTMPGTLTRSVKAVLMPRDRSLRAAVDRWMTQQIATGVPARLLDQAM